MMHERSTHSYVWMMYEWCMNDAWMMHERNTHSYVKWCMKEIHIVMYEWCMKEV